MAAAPLPDFVRHSRGEFAHVSFAPVSPPNKPGMTVKQGFNVASMFGFGILAEMANKVNEKHGAHRLWTAPVSLIGAGVVAVVSSLVAVVQLVAAPFFLAMALIRCNVAKNAIYWADLAAFSLCKGVGTLLAMPLAISATAVAPRFVREMAESIGRYDDVQDRLVNHSFEDDYPTSHPKGPVFVGLSGEAYDDASHSPTFAAPHEALS